MYCRFPKNPVICSLWLKVCNLSETDDVSKVWICSNHFNPEDYRNLHMEAFGLPLRLKPEAVPSVSVPNPIYSEISMPSTSTKGAQYDSGKYIWYIQF